MTRGHCLDCDAPTDASFNLCDPCVARRNPPPPPGPATDEKLRRTAVILGLRRTTDIEAAS